MRRSPQNVNAAGSPGGWQEITIDTRTRVAAGLCVLSLAVLSCGFGEAVATADSEAGDSISGTPDSIGGTDRLGSDSEQVISTPETEPTGGIGDTGGTGTVDTIPELLGALAGIEPQPESEPGGTQTHEEPAGPAGPMALGRSFRPTTTRATR